MVGRIVNQLVLPDQCCHLVVPLYNEYVTLFGRPTFILFKPDVYTQFGKLVNMIYANNFTISRMKMSKLTVAEARTFYSHHENQPYFQELVQFMSSDLSVGCEVVGENAIEFWRTQAGNWNSITAKVENPKSIRAIFGSEGVRNAIHVSFDGQAAKKEAEFWFKLKCPALLSNCSCCVIKPHAVMSGYAGLTIDQILEEGFEISALQMFYLDRPTAEEFLEVYRGVLPEYVPIVEHMTSGPCIAMEVRQENVVNALREVCGPLDPEIAKSLRSHTIRAKYGVDRVMNAVHCTDLPEDGVLECDYFFNIMQTQ